MAMKLQDFKKKAKELAVQHKMKPTHAHEVLARSYGYKTYNAYLAEVRKNGN